MPRYARRNNSNQASIDRYHLFAEGAFKNVYEGKYTTGKRAGERCVSKEFKSGCVYEKSYFDNELKVVYKTLDLVNLYNKERIVNRPIWLNMPAVWTYSEESDRAGQKSLIEPMILNFEKFNSNTGWTPDNQTAWVKVMQSLSHFSYHISSGEVLCCDLQGGIYRDGFIITDPVIMSRSSNYGPSDLGPKGISTFFAHHYCNEYCNTAWITPRDTGAYFTVQKGSAMKLPTRFSRPALSRYAPGSVIEEEEDYWEDSDEY